jgi:hypothetical protein
MKMLLLVLLLAATVVQAETYRWTDRDGTIHFSESPGEVPADYRKSAESLHQADNSGSVPPMVDGLKKQMINDEGIMTLIRSIQNDPEMQALLRDPATIGAIQAGDFGSLANNPVFLKLLNNPRVREIEKRMQQNGSR